MMIESRLSAGATTHHAECGHATEDQQRNGGRFGDAHDGQRPEVLRDVRSGKLRAVYGQVIERTVEELLCEYGSAGSDKQTHARKSIDADEICADALGKYVSINRLLQSPACAQIRDPRVENGIRAAQIVSCRNIIPVTVIRMVANNARAVGKGGERVANSGHNRSGDIATSIRLLLRQVITTPSARTRLEDIVQTAAGDVVVRAWLNHRLDGHHRGRRETGCIQTLVYDATAMTTLGLGEFRLYRDGALIGTDSGEGLPILSPLAGTTQNRLGHGASSPYAGGATPLVDLPDFLTGSISEFRVYNHVIATNDVLFSAVAGPDTTSVTFTDKTWSGAASDWNTGGNWAAAGVPALANRAILSNGGTASVAATVPTAGTVRVTNGTISVGAGGVLESKFPIELQPGAAGSSTINVNGGGRLVISGILNDAAAGTKSINVDNGTVAAGFGSALVNAGATINIGAGGATFSSGTGQMSVSSSLAGSGNLTKTGSGTLAVRAPTAALGLTAQNPNFSGEVFVNEGTIDMQLDHGVFGTAGSTRGGKLHMADGTTLAINTAFPAGGGFRKEVPTDLQVTGNVLVRNMVDRAATEIRLQGSLSGDGTITFTKPNLPVDALGIDLENRPPSVPQVGDYNNNGRVDAADYTIWRNRLGQTFTMANEEPNTTVGMVTPEDYDVWKANFGLGSGDGGIVDNSGFTGRFVATGNWAVRFRAAGADLPNAIFEMNDPGAWAGKRGPDANQVIELGGVAGLAGSRLLSAIAGDGDGLADVTYRIGGAAQNAVFNGSIVDSNNPVAGVPDNVFVEKVGNNTQTFAGANTYSGTTTISGGKLLVNGTHQMDAVTLLPVGDYTVNSGGTLGGTGIIGTVADPVNVNASGGTISPGTSVGTLTVNGDAIFGNGSHFGVEISGSTVDLLSVANLNLSSTSDFLDVSVLGSANPGNYVIAQYSGSLSGTFNSVTGGYTVNYATPGQVILNVPALVGSGSLAAVPEPASLALVTLGALFLGVRRRRR